MIHLIGHIYQSYREYKVSRLKNRLSQIEATLRFYHRVYDGKKVGEKIVKELASLYSKEAGIKTKILDLGENSFFEV